MSAPPCFIDSNVWLYRLMTDPQSSEAEEIRKHYLAATLIDSVSTMISTQIINEVCCVLKRKASFSENQLKQVIRALYSRCTVVELNLDVLISAADLREQHSFSFWDGLIVASALLANAEILYSEDMHSGLIVANRLEIVNPFE